jgi:Leucine-rich repeat (LRR) protein
VAEAPLLSTEFPRSFFAEGSAGQIALSMDVSPPNSARPERARGRLRFSLKWLLLAITAICVWLGMLTYRANRQKEAVETIGKVGGIVAYRHQWDFSGEFPQIIANRKPPGPAWLRKLIGDHYFVRADTTWLFGSGDTDAAIGAVATLHELEILHLQGPNVTDQALAQIRHLRRLRRLDLDGTSITDEGLAHVANLTELESLTIAGRYDSAVGSTGNLASLRWIPTPISDAGLTHLVRLKKLQALDLAGAAITDAGLVTIGKMKSLKSLDLARTSVSDQGIHELENLTNLTSLSVLQTGVTEEGLKRLKAALPNLGIANVQL